MNTYILWVLFQSLSDWIGPMVWRNKNVTLKLNSSFRLIRSYCWVISHVNIDFILVTPSGTL